MACTNPILPQFKVKHFTSDRGIYPSPTLPLPIYHLRIIIGRGRAFYYHPSSPGSSTRATEIWLLWSRWIHKLKNCCGKFAPFGVLSVKCEGEGEGDCDRR
jgi:hypothetical protein